MHRPLLQDLPEVLREDPATQELLRAFERLMLGGDDDLLELKVLDTNPTGLESRLDELPRYFTPGTTEVDGTPDEFLPWLSQWVALSLRTDITFGADKSVTRENELRRNFIADLARIYRFRGTKQSMQELLGVFTARRELKNGRLVVTPREVVINDQVDGQPYYFVIQVDLEEIKGGDSIAAFNHVKALADSVIRLEKPAHTRHLLIPAVTTMRIGQRAEPPRAPPGAHLPTKDHIRVGGKTPLGVVIGNTRLGVVPRNPKSVWEL